MATTSPSRATDAARPVSPTPGVPGVPGAQPPGGGAPPARPVPKVPPSPAAGVVTPPPAPADAPVATSPADGTPPAPAVGAPAVAPAAAPAPKPATTLTTPAAVSKPAAATPPPADAPPPAAAEAPAGRHIELKGERLTARLDDVPLDDVIALFCAASGAEVRGSPAASRQVSADFADVPLYEGLSRLMGSENFTLTFREDGTVKTLRLLGGPQNALPATQVVRNDAGTPTASGIELMQHRVPIPPGSRLSQHLGGGDSASLQQLLDTSLRETDPGIRTEALRAGLGGVEAEPALREATIKALGEVDDATLENVVRAVARDNARELVAQVSTFTKINEVRSRGFALLRQLNQPGGQ